MVGPTAARHGDLFRSISANDLNVVGERGNLKSQRLFGRMFSLDPYAPGPDVLKAVADEMNWVNQTSDPSGDSAIPSGYTVLGAFITHDISFDRSPLSGRPVDPLALENHRIPTLDLDSVYGESPELVRRHSPETHFTPTHDPDTGEMLYRKSTNEGEPDDLLRYSDVEDLNLMMLDGNGDPIVDTDGHPIKVPDAQALISDGRNDENVLISQLHLAFLKLHNRFARDIKTSQPNLSGDEVFERARQQCRWRYQWVVVNEFLPKIVGQDMVDSILKKEYGQFTVDLKLYESDTIAPPTIPVEFSAAAFRFGHSMVRAVYRVNAAGTQFPLFSASESDARHLGGSRRLPAALVVDWARFFDDLTPSKELAKDRQFFRNKAKKIDSYLNELLTRLPPQAIPERGASVERSLALRDLQRAVELGLPSGQEVASKVRTVLDGDFPILSYDLGLHKFKVDAQAPLWFYLLKEAEIIGRGEQLGPVGGRIVAEVILGLLGYDDQSYLRKCPSFSPTGPDGEPFSMAALLRLAGVAP